MFDINNENNKRKNLFVCKHCLSGIKSHEGQQTIIEHYIDEENETESKCDWCKEHGFDTLYELV